MTNLVVNKKIKRKGTFCRQSVLKYFEPFGCFTKFSFHHKWNDERMLLINMVYASYLTTSRTISDLGSWETEKIEERF